MEDRPDRRGASRPRRCLRAAALAALLTALAGSAPGSAPAADETTHPRKLASVALHPWRLERRGHPPLWPLREQALRERTFSRIEAAGVRYARIDLKWSSVEPHGSLLRDWSEFDATVATASKHGVKLVPMVSYTPGWANGGQHWFTYPRDPRDFERFMTEAMRRYPGIPAWEIWNEPNYEAFSPPAPDARKFVAMLRAAHRARTRAGSRAKLISGGLAPDGPAGMHAFIDQMARFGAFDLVDGLGVHPYGGRAPDDLRSNFMRLPRIREHLLRLGRPNVKLWITEYGVPTVSSASFYGPPAGEESQAVALRTAFALAAGWPWVENLTWYGLRDDCSDGANPDCRFGLLREDFSPKLGFGALREVASGALPKLRSATALHARRVRRRLRLRGRLITPGADAAGRTVAVSLRRRARRGWRLRRRLSAQIGDGGRYRLGPLRLRAGRWRVRADFPGTSRYAASRSRTLSVRLRPSRRFSRRGSAARSRRCARPRCSRSP